MADVNQEKYAAAAARIATGEWSVDARRGTVLGALGRPIGYKTASGYTALAINDGRRTLRPLAHRVIWEHRHGPIPDGMQINHIDGVKSNNAIDNLELVTPQGNQLHALALGLAHGNKGESHPRAKVTDALVRQIRDRVAGGERQYRVAQDLGLSKAQVCRICSGKNWQHISAA